MSTAAKTKTPDVHKIKEAAFAELESLADQLAAARKAEADAVEAMHAKVREVYENGIAMPAEIGRAARYARSHVNKILGI